MNDEVHGARLIGDSPRRLELDDGTVLVLATDEADDHATWQRIEGPERHTVSVADALRLAGDPYAGYVRVRTRAESEWLRTLAEWCREEADRLERELTAGPA